MPLNCAAVPEALLESELFGHERGAFTGATGSKPGLFEAADGGTLFLDEVGDLAPATQSKLLRALESGEVTRVGSVRTKLVDVTFGEGGDLLKSAAEPLEDGEGTIEDRFVREAELDDAALRKGLT